MLPPGFELSRACVAGFRLEVGIYARLGTLHKGILAAQVQRPGVKAPITKEDLMSPALHRGCGKPLIILLERSSR
jgi:hypothetical protein